MEESAEIENNNFRHHHHLLRTKSDATDPFIKASYKRKALAQWYHASLSLCDAAETCQIYGNRAPLYHKIVDERGEGSVNNYASASLVVASSAGKNDTSKWKSGLRSNRPVSSVVQKLTNCPGKCSSREIAEEDLKSLAKGFHAAVSGGSVENKTGNGNVGFIPKRPVVSQHTVCQGMNSKEQVSTFPGKSYPSTSKQNQKGSESMFRSSSSDFTENSEKVTRCQEQQFAHSERSDGFLRSNSDEFGKKNNEFNGFRKFGCGGGPNQAMDHCNKNSSNFGVKNASNNLGGNIRGIYDEPHFGSVPGSKNMVTGNSGQWGGGSSYSCGAQKEFYNQNTMSGWNRNSGPSGFKSNERNQPEVGMSSISASIFKTARDELAIQNQKKYGNRGGGNIGRGSTMVPKRSLGTARRAGVHGKFVPPVKQNDEDDFGGMFGVKQPGMEGENEEEVDERLKNIDPKMVETIRNEIMDIGAPVEWDDIAGLDFAKKTIQEIVVWPLLRPDIFTGLRKPPKGLLLFGPPGTGKTLIGKCIASQSQSTFFSISASSLTSKWIGDGEKMVRALFAVAKVHQPSVVFIDEIDSLLTQRSDTEHESSRRIKTEFLVQLDGAGTGDEERILVVGATNRPHELDEAARRRLVKRLYIPLPEFPARKQIVERLMSNERCSLTSEQIHEIASLTDGYSGADMKNLCQEASLGPIRSISFSAMHQITADQVRPISIDDFKAALQRVRASVSNKDLDAYVQWDKTYGMGSGL